MEKEVVSPFELAIMQAANVPTDNVRTETKEEKEERLRVKFKAFWKDIRCKSK